MAFRAPRPEKRRSICRRVAPATGRFVRRSDWVSAERRSQNERRLAPPSDRCPLGFAARRGSPRGRNEGAGSLTQGDESDARIAALTREIEALKAEVEHLRLLADHDTLTPVLNRRAFLR
jgi:hypothetical protein